MVKPANRTKKIYSSAELLSQLRNRKNFQYSPVFYLAAILEDYFDDRITKEELADTYRRETVRAQFIFSQMSPSDIQTNKCLFKEEFAFADALTSVIVSGGSAAESDFYRALRRCMENYLFP